MLEAKVGILFLFLIKVYQVTTTNNYHPITPRFLPLLRAAFLLSLSRGSTLQHLQITPWHTHLHLQAYFLGNQSMSWSK